MWQQLSTSCTIPSLFPCGLSVLEVRAFPFPSSLPYHPLISLHSPHTMMLVAAIRWACWFEHFLWCPVVHIDSAMMSNTLCWFWFSGSCCSTQHVEMVACCCCNCWNDLLECLACCWCLIWLGGGWILPSSVLMWWLADCHRHLVTLRECKVLSCHLYKATKGWIGWPAVCGCACRYSLNQWWHSIMALSPAEIQSLFLLMHSRVNGQWPQA